MVLDWDRNMSSSSLNSVSTIDIYWMMIPLSTKYYYIFGQWTANYCRSHQKLSWGWYWLRLLLLCTGIETNPGPIWTCPFCTKNLSARAISIRCSSYSNWLHVKSSGLHTSEDHRKFQTWTGPCCQLQPPAPPTQSRPQPSTAPPQLQTQPSLALVGFRGKLIAGTLSEVSFWSLSSTSSAWF